MQGKVQHVDRVDCFEIDLFSFLPFLPFPFDLQKISIIIFLPFPPPFPGGKIIHEKQKRVLIYLQIEQEHCFERETSQSVKIIKPIRMDQPESKGNYRSNHRTNKSRSTVMASGILSITYFLSTNDCILRLNWEIPFTEATITGRIGRSLCPTVSRFNRSN